MDGDDIDSIVDKNWNAHMEKMQESFINVRYHPFFYNMKHVMVLEVAIREFFNFESPKSICLSVFWNGKVLYAI